MPTATGSPSRKRGRPPRTNADDIVKAATTLFARFGYRNTTIATIAEAVGVAETSILHYFDSKLAILEEALDADEAAANDEFLEQLKPGGLQALRNIAAWGARMEARPETTSLQVVLSAESLSAGSELHGRFHERYRYLRRRLSRALERGIAAGEIRADINAVHEATALLAFMDGLRLQWFYADGAISLDEHFRAFLDQLIERIGAKA